MPVLVQWKWKERTKSFVVIFHFYDDFSRLNLRTKNRTFLRTDKRMHVSIPYLMNVQFNNMENRFEGKKTVTTWAPSHLELAHLSQILSYANIIDGLQEVTKRKLRYKLEIVVESEDGKYDVDDYCIEDILSRTQDKMIILGGDPKKGYTNKFSCCIELCPEYIDYLKNVLKPYIS